MGKNVLTQKCFNPKMFFLMCPINFPQMFYLMCPQPKTIAPHLLSRDKLWYRNQFRWLKEVFTLLREGKYIYPENNSIPPHIIEIASFITNASNKTLSAVWG